METPVSGRMLLVVFVLLRGGKKRSVGITAQRLPGIWCEIKERESPPSTYFPVRISGRLTIIKIKKLTMKFLFVLKMFRFELSRNYEFNQSELSSNVKIQTKGKVCFPNTMTNL